MKKLASILSFCFGLLSLHAGYAQTIASQQDGDWNDTNTWAGGVVPTNANSTAILIQHAVNIPTGQVFSIDQTTIDVTGFLTIANGATITLANGTGNDLTVDGILQVDGTLINSNLAFIANTDGSNVSFSNGSNFTWQYTTTEGIPPLASWEDGSTFNITGYTTLTALTSSNWDQSFYNLTWNANSLANTFNFDGKITEIRGTLDIISVTGAARIIRLNATLNSSISIGSINVSGNSTLNMNTSGITTVDVLNDLTITGAAALLQLNTTGTLTLNIGQDFNYNTSFVGAVGSYGNLSGTLNMNVERDINITASTGRFRGVQTSGTANITVGRNFALNSGSFGENGTNATIVMNFNNGTSHTFLNSGTMTGSCFQYNIGVNDTLVLGTSPLVGSSGGTCVCQLNLDGTLEVGNTIAAGAIQTNTSSGNIRVPTVVGSRNYNPGSTIIYRSSSNLFMGNGHPSTSPGVNTIIDISATGITMTGNRTITGDLTILDGTLALNGSALTLEGNLTYNAGSSIVTTATSDLIINGSGAFGTLPLSGTNSLDVFTLNRSGGTVSPDQNLTISGVTTLTDGTLDFSGRNLTLNGQLSVTSGLLGGNSSSTFTIGGTGTISTLDFDPTLNTLGTFTYNRIGATITLNGNLTIATALNLTNGILDNLSGLILGNNATLTRSAGSITTSRPLVNLGESYNVTYSGAATSGLELPDPTNNTDLQNLTIGANVTLNQNVTVNGILNLSSGTFNCGANTITMQGSTWNDNAGNFTPGSGSVVFNGNTTIGGSSTPAFGNLTLNSGATLTLPSGNLDLTGNLQLTAGATLNPGTGTVNFIGVVNQQLAGAGLTLNNITVNTGSSSDVTLTSPLNLTGVLTVSSTNSEFISNGNLTLISTSDAASGNGSIASLTAAGAAITGNVTVQRYMSSEGRIYRYISSPITNGTVASVQDDAFVTGNFTGTSSCSGCTTSASMFRYDGATSTYIGYPVNADGGTAAPLVPGRGYAIFIRQDLYPGAITFDYTGPVNQGNVGITVAHNGIAAESWNLVGNPYPSTIDWDIVAGWTKTNISGTIAVRDNGASGVYRYWDGSVGGLTNGLIATGQGFWVRTTAASPVLTINENAKVNTTGAYIRSAPVKAPDALTVTISKGDVADWAFFRLRENANDKFDLYDSPKLINDLLNLGSRTTDGKLVAINALGSMQCGTELNLDLSFTKRSNGTFVLPPAGIYSLNLDKSGVMEGYKLRFVDRFTGKTHLIDDNETIQLEITDNPESYASNRWYIVLDEELPTTNVLVSNSAFCDNKSSKIVIQDANPGNRYRFYSGTNMIREVGGGNYLEAEILVSQLQPNNKSVYVEAVGICGTALPVTTLILETGTAPQITTTGGVLCDAGAMELQVSSTSSLTEINWYETSDATEPVYTSSESTWMTPILTKSKTFYVSGMASNGCESARIPVQASINYLEPITIQWGLEVADLTISTTAQGEIQWFYEGEAIAGANQPSLTPELSGIYSVAINNGGCISQADYILEITSLEELGNKGITVYPNPIQSEVNILLNPYSGYTKAILFSGTGATIGTSTIVATDGKDRGRMDVSQTPAGIYFVRVMGTGKSLIFKVIKD